MRDRAERILEDVRRIATMSEETGRTTRRYLSAPVHDVHAYLGARMDTLGMTVHVDSVGNLRGVWQPKMAGERRLLLGSHIDTVPDAGAFDGVLGVVLALEWVVLAQESNVPVSIEVIAFSEEEGVRFGVPFLGSRAVAGTFDPALLTLRNADGVSVEDAIRTFGLNPALIPDAATGDDAIGFVEVHIEQGPVLDTEGIPLAAVTAIVGQTRGTMEFVGHANHAGTTPMPLRRDALAAAAEWITAVESLAQSTADLVATVGRISVKPNAGNVVPGEVHVSLDLRHPLDDGRHAAVDSLVQKAREIADRRGLVNAWQVQIDQSAVPMDARLTEALTDAIGAVGLPTKKMVSGAGHDAMVMASRVPTAMLFLRSPGGISHHPDETVLLDDVECALRVGREFLQELGRRQDVQSRDGIQ